jgi:hypothetical protein
MLDGHRRRRRSMTRPSWLLCVLVLVGGPWMVASQTQGTPPWQAFVAAAGTDRRQSDAALDDIEGGWRNGYASMIIDVARFLPAPRGVGAGDDVGVPTPDTTFEDEPQGAARGRSEFPAVVRQPPGADIRRRLTGFIGKQTRQGFGDDLRAWRRWIWAQPYEPHPDYAPFKAEVYSRIDPRFRAFFPAGVETRIRLDEVDWGGVTVNGIPPLRFPKTISAADARWLRDGHVVFGLVVNGEARAYPKRILAWHEMAIDRIGGAELTIVYCTLCGTVIPYDSVIGSRHFTFGTSGLLYRSNKLMFDEETRTLWSSLEGVPVIGPLAKSGFQLTFRAVVTTTWGEWRREHPTTTVLSLDTGFERDYSEGAAYRDYFATDRLMFEVPTTDTRLKNKDEVLVLRSEVLGVVMPPTAIAIARLRRNPVFAFEAGGRPLVAITSKAGANAVYERGAHMFASRSADGSVSDESGGRWTVVADALVGPGGAQLARVPAHRAFWFGWIAQYPDTVLIQ